MSKRYRAGAGKTVADAFSNAGGVAPGKRTSAGAHYANVVPLVQRLASNAIDAPKEDSLWEQRATIDDDVAAWGREGEDQSAAADVDGDSAAPALGPRMLARARKRNPHWAAKLAFSPDVFGCFFEVHSAEFAEAVASYQGENGLTVDGIAGPKTYDTRLSIQPNGADELEHGVLGAEDEMEPGVLGEDEEIAVVLGEDDMRAQRRAARGNSDVMEPGVLDVQGKGMAAASGDVHQAASRGLEGPATTLPFADRIQASFGKHDLSSVDAHIGGAAKTASKAMGAEAYATGNQVAFGEQPSLHTAAHEAAHVVQQRGGVQLKDGVGERGDSHEQHADAVADRVVAGGSAEDLLDHVSSIADSSASVQRKAVQFWLGSEHHAMGDMAATIATRYSKGTDENAKEREKYLDKYRDNEKFKNKKSAIRSKKDRQLRNLERQGRKAILVGRRGISFGEASQLAGDHSDNTKELAMKHPQPKSSLDDWMRGMLLASTNINHFYPLAGEEYKTHHRLALDAALAGDRDRALLEEGFASHFLEDSFAAGHMAPRALDRTNLSSMEEDELGLNRSMFWHDALNAVNDTDGMPVSTGERFHGDGTMTGNDLTKIAQEVAASLSDVLKTLASGSITHTPITIREPNRSEIMQSNYGPIWHRMMTDYEKDLRDAEKSPRMPESVTTDGGTTMGTRDMAQEIRTSIYGGKHRLIYRMTNSEWNGDILVFNLMEVPPRGKARPAPAKSRVWVQWFDRDLGNDHHKSGYEDGTISSRYGPGMFRDDDEKIGQPMELELRTPGIGYVRAPSDRSGHTYAVFYMDSPCTLPVDMKRERQCTVPTGRSEVQGKSRGKVKKPFTISRFSWSGNRLSFKATRNGRRLDDAGHTVYVRWYRKDSGFDHDSRGNLDQTIIDSDPQRSTGAKVGVTALSGVDAVMVDGSGGSIVAQGKANSPGDTYAVVYLDFACRIPLGRSPVQRSRRRRHSAPIAFP